MANQCIKVMSQLLESLFHNFSPTKSYHSYLGSMPWEGAETGHSLNSGSRVTSFFGHTPLKLSLHEVRITSLTASVTPNASNSLRFQPILHHSENQVVSEWNDNPIS